MAQRQSCCSHGLSLCFTPCSDWEECLQYEMCMSKHPFTAQNEGALIRKILRGVYPPATGYSGALLSLIQACLSYQPRMRPSVPELLARPEVTVKARALSIPLDSSALVRQAQKKQLQHAPVPRTIHPGKEHVRLGSHSGPETASAQAGHPFAAPQLAPDRAYGYAAAQPASSPWSSNQEKEEKITCDQNIPPADVGHFAAQPGLHAAVKLDAGIQAVCFASDVCLCRHACCLANCSA